jgi:hypothetical protein
MEERGRLKRKWKMRNKRSLSFEEEIKFVANQVPRAKRT